MKQNLGTFFVLLLAIQAISSQSLALDITLNPNEVTAFNIQGLFAQAQANNKLNNREKASNGHKVAALGQQPATYTTSHQAATVQTMGQISHALSVLKLSKDQNVDGFAYDSIQNILSLVASGTYYRLKYDQNNHVYTLLATLDVVPGTTCTGFDATSKIAVVGCLAEDQKSADFYAIKDDKLAGDKYTVTFPEHQEIMGGLRVDLSTRGDEFVVFSDTYKRTEDDPQQVGIYYLTIDDNTGVMSLNNVVTSITTEDQKTITFDQLNEIYMLPGDDNLKAFVSALITGTGVFDLHVCGVLIDDQTKAASFIDCQSQKVSQANLHSGRLRYFPGLGLPFVLIYDEEKGIVTQCLNAGEEEGYSDCVSTIRAMPFDFATTNVQVSFTAYSNNLAATFTDKDSGQIWTIYNINRYEVDEDTQALDFDLVIEAAPKAILVLERGQVTVLFEETFKTYAALAPASWMLQITANDLPSPSSNSDVTNKRLLIKVSRDEPAADLWVRVVVLDDIDSWMGFTDNLPDFGGLTGGYGIANIDRSWMYGNDLSVKVQSSALNKPILLDRMDFEFTHNDQVVWTKLFVQNEFRLVAQDATKLYYYTCEPGKNNNNDCVSKFDFTLPDGLQIVKVFDSVSHPDVLQGSTTIAFLQDKDANAFLYYIYEPNFTKNVLVDLKTAVRDLHIINYRGTFLIFYSPTSGDDAKNVVVMSGPNDPLHFKDLVAVTSITPEYVGLPSESTFAPMNLVSCGHNDYVVEYLSSTGYIVKLNVFGPTSKDIKLRANVRIVNPADPTFVAAGFCPMGDEFILWDKDYESIFSTSTITDNSAYYFRLDRRSLHAISTIGCAPKSATVGIFGRNNDMAKVVATIFGNQYNAAHSKIHSFELLPVTSFDFEGTYSMTPSGIAHVGISGGKTYVKHMILGGPYLLYGLQSEITDPTLSLSLTSGREVRNLNVQLNIAQVERAVRVDQIKKTTPIDKGSINLEDAAKIVGHITTATLSNVPESLKDIITLQNRLTAVQSLHSESSNAFEYEQILAADASKLLRIGTNNGVLSVELKQTGQQDVVFTSALASYTSIDGFFDDDSANAVVSVLSKMGGEYSVLVIFIPYDTKKSTSSITSTLDSGYMETIRIIRVPGANPTYAVFVSMKIANLWLVYKVTKSDNTVEYWDTINNCFNLWPVRSAGAGLAFFNSMRDTQLSLYKLQDATVIKGTTQGGIYFSGSNNEFKDVSCVNYNSKTIECVLVTWGPTNLHFKTTLNDSWVVPMQDGAPVLTSRTLFNFVEGQDVTGSYTHARVIQGYAILKSLDRTYEVYKTDADSQGYIYARVPALSAFSKDRLGYSVMHDALDDERDFFIYSNADNVVQVVRLNSASSNGPGVDTFSVQPLTLKVTDTLNDDSANKILINLGSAAQITAINITSILEPIKPKPDPPAPPKPEDKKKLTWLWILLGVIGVALVVVLVVFVFKRQKQFGAEDDAYQKNEPFVEEGTMSEKKRKNSDEFN